MHAKKNVERIVHCFVREGTGVWRCVQRATLELPEGRVQINAGTLLGPGDLYMNVDVVAVLEEQQRIFGPQPRR